MTRRRSTIRGRSAPATSASLVLAVVLAACASAPQVTPAEREVEQRQRRGDEIIALHNRISGMRLELGLQPRPPERFLRASTDDADTPSWTPAPEKKTPDCQDVCDLAEHICAAKDDICRIASELPGDTWAADKCSDARASCREAQKLCTDCR